MTETTKPRAQIASDDCWNVADLYPDWKHWETEFAAQDPTWPQLVAYQGRLREGPEVLKSALDLKFTTERALEKLYTYAHLRHDEEITLDAHKAAFQKASSLIHTYHEVMAWFEPELLALPSDVFAGYVTAAPLAGYRIYLEKLERMRPHTLTADKEALLAMAGKSLETAPKAFSALNNADLKFPNVQDQEGKSHPLSHGLYQLYLRSHDRTLRENAFTALHSTFDGFENTLCELLQGEIQSHAFGAKVRNYPSSLEAALFPKNIPQQVYRSLISSVRAGLPTLHRYVSLRKELMGVDKLHLYDMYVPLVAQNDQTVDYATAESHVIESVAPLGSEYQNLLRRGLLEERWVDRYENENKRSGAYSSGCYDSYPYILMNYRGTLRDLFTLAHEAGHSMHSQLSALEQPYHYSRYPIFVAEVASTFNEELLMHHLEKTSTDANASRYLINEKIEDLRATFFRQTMFAEFELTLHTLVEEGTPLTPALLKELYLKLNTDYFGPDATIDPLISIEWARIPHFYYNFYVYQYATGISAALALAEKVLAGDKTATQNYLNFLKGGSSRFPIDLLKGAGVDMATPDPVNATLRKFNTLLDQLAVSAK